MKKLLALILSVIMVLSIMPMAYAQRATYSPEIEEYIEDYIKYYTYTNSIYKTTEQRSEVVEIFEEALNGKTEIVPSYEYFINIDADNRLEELTACHESLKKGIDEVEKRIAEDKIGIVIDIYEYSKYVVLIHGPCYYSAEYLDEVAARIENYNSEKYINALNEAEMGFIKIDRIGDTAPQSEFDDAMAMIKPLYDSVLACADGDHFYGEYISDNNATEDADGTKTAICEFCGATDTIVDEGTKRPKEEASLYEMLFDLIKDFIALILTMFK